jgi:hypothetical protein
VHLIFVSKREEHTHAIMSNESNYDGSIKSQFNVIDEETLIKEYNPRYPEIGLDMMSLGSMVLREYWSDIIERELRHAGASDELIEKAKLGIILIIHRECKKVEDGHRWGGYVRNDAIDSEVSDMINKMDPSFRLKYAVTTEITLRRITAYTGGYSFPDRKQWVLWSKEKIESPLACLFFVHELGEQIPYEDDVTHIFINKILDHLVMKFTRQGEKEVRIGHARGESINVLHKLLRESLIETNTLPEPNECEAIPPGFCAFISNALILSCIYPRMEDGSLDYNNGKSWIAWRNVSTETLKTNIEKAVDWWVDQLQLVGNTAGVYAGIMRSYLTKGIIENGRTSVDLITDYGPVKLLFTMHRDTEKAIGTNLNVTYPFKLHMSVGDDGVIVNGKDISEIGIQKQPTVLDEYSGEIALINAFSLVSEIERRHQKNNNNN